MEAKQANAQKCALGKFGESLACNYLSDLGYSIEERNYRFHHKELDIVAKDKDVFVIVEVKTRSANSMFDGSWSINRQKISNVTTAGFAYAKAHLPNGGVRFDAVICQQNIDGTFTITHEKNAFCAPWKTY